MVLVRTVWLSLWQHVVSGAGKAIGAFSSPEACMKAHQQGIFLAGLGLVALVLQPKRFLPPQSLTM